MMKKKTSVCLSSDGFSFHTFELRYYPGNKAFSAIHNAVKVKSKAKKCDYYPLKEHPSTYYSSAFPSSPHFHLHTITMNQYGSVPVLLRPFRKLYRRDFLRCSFTMMRSWKHQGRNFHFRRYCLCPNYPPSATCYAPCPNTRSPLRFPAFPCPPLTVSAVPVSTPNISPPASP